MHFTAMGAALIVPDPTVDVSWGSAVDSSMMAFAIGGLTVLIMLASLAATLIDRQTALDNKGQIRELVDAASEGIVIAVDGEIVNANQRVIELSGHTLQALVGKSVSGDLLHDVDLQPADADTQTTEALLIGPDGRPIPVEVIRRKLQAGLRGNEVYAIRDLTERRRSEAKIAHMARHDALTDLPNRILLRERLEPALTSANGDQKVALLCIDLDRFKAVNDMHGHPVGDVLLKQVAKRLLGCVRARDTVARIGGDEFVVVHSSADPSKEAAALAARLIEVVGAPYEVDGHHVMIGASVGIAVAQREEATPETLLVQADMALYSSKNSGRGTYSFFEQEMNTLARERRELEQDLRQALVKGELSLAYQPLVNLASNEISSVEALLRWRHPRRGMIAPNDFIPLAEETGLIVPIGEWVLRHACAEAAGWPAEVKVAVNLSPVQFKSRKLFETIFAAMASSGVPPDRLELEITESVFLQDSDGTLETLKRLRDLGVSVSLDDFGTGYSSLNYLQRFPFDKIKIDRCFLVNASDAGGNLAVIRAISGLGRALGLTVTAEGVETQEQLDLVRSEGCTEMQGFYFTPPVTAEELRRRFLTMPAGARAPAGIVAA
jgi:diguanylate cyclase (GGDEF)-like protein/PAS domain S-box-containing protein